MAHKSKMLKYSIDRTYQNVSSLLLWIKSQFEKYPTSAGPKQNNAFGLPSLVFQRNFIISELKSN